MHLRIQVRPRRVVRAPFRSWHRPQVFRKSWLVVAAGLLILLYSHSAAAQLTLWGHQLWKQGSAYGLEDAAELNDNFGNAVAIADFNNDGYDDLVVGVRSEDLTNPTVLHAGAIHVIYGSPIGLTDANDQFLHQNSAGIQGTAEEGDGFGYSLAVGDFDNDGRDDVAVGVVDEAIDGQDEAGAVHIIYGSDTGLSTRDEIWHQNDTGITGACEADDHFGFAVAAGDFDNDGYDDVAVGVPDENLSGIVDAGMVHVLYGGPSGISATDSQGWHQNSTSVSGANEHNDEFGSALTTGDFDNDGYDDLAVGVPGEAVGSDAAAGRVVILFGSAAGISASRDQSRHQDTSGIDDSAEPGDEFASALTVGDFDNDGFDDLVVGVPGESITYDGEGAVHVLYGDATGVSTDGRFFYMRLAGVPGTSYTNDRFGYAVTAGDFDDDGHDDLAVGAPWHGGGSEGSTVVLYGYSGGVTSNHGQIWELSTEIAGWLGFSLATGDFNGDWYQDLAVGGPGVGLPGSVHALYGTELILLEVFMTPPGAGTVTSDPPGIDCGAQCWAEYPIYTDVTLTPVPEPGFVFYGWGGLADCSDGQVNLNMPTFCTAVFGQPDHTLMVTKNGTGTGTVTSNPAGIDCGSVCQYDFIETTVVILTPTPSIGSVFTGWSGDPDCSDGQVTIDGDITCNATFDLLPSRTLTVTKDGTGSGTVTSSPVGIDCGIDCEHDFAEFTVVTLTPTADLGHLFMSWSGNGDCSDGQVTMNSDMICNATFNLNPDLIFANGFESGDTQMWFETQP